MLKWIGILAISAASLLLGNRMSARLSDKVKIWEQSARLATRLSTQIGYTLAPIPALFAEITKTGDYTSLPFLSEITSETEEWEKRWETEINRLKPLSNAEKQLFLAFIRPLGQTDLAGQTAHCRSFAKQFEEQKQHADREWKEKGRLYPLMGLLGAVAVALLLI